MYNKLKCNSYRRKIMKLTEQRLKRLIKQVLNEGSSSLTAADVEEALLTVLLNVNNPVLISELKLVCVDLPKECSSLIRLLTPYSNDRYQR